MALGQVSRGLRGHRLRLVKTGRACWVPRKLHEGAEAACKAAGLV